MTTETEDKILIAAAELFAEKGYAATTTKAVALRAGVNEVTLFRRFENKAGILRALGERWAETQAGFAAPTMPEPEDTRGTIDALARMEISNAIRDGGVAMRLLLDAQTVPEVAEIMGSGPSREHAGTHGLPRQPPGRWRPARRHRSRADGRGALRVDVDAGDEPATPRPCGERPKNWEQRIG